MKIVPHLTNEALFAIDLQRHVPNQLLLIWRGQGQAMYAKKMLFKFQMPKAANDE